MSSSASSSADEESFEETSQLIIRFYDPDIKAKDAQNRTLQEILSWPDSRLESSHNYIQMLFPLPEGSMFNWGAPVIDLAVMQAFRVRSELRQQLRRSFERMLSFYGFQVSTESETELHGEQDEQKAVSKMTQTDEYKDNVVVPDNFTSGTKTPSESTSPSVSDNKAPASSPLPYNIVRAANWREQFQNWAVLFDHNHLRITRILRCLRVLGLQRESTAFFAALEQVFQDPEIKISGKSMRFWQLAVMQPLHLAPDGQKCRWLETWEREQEDSKKSVNSHEDVHEHRESYSRG